jgi:hypothetical protein
MNDVKLIEMVEDVCGLKVGMASIEDKLDGLSHRLLGNGQPGLIADLQSTDRALTRRMDKWNGIWIGGSGVVVVIFTEMEFLFRRYFIHAD